MLSLRPKTDPDLLTKAQTAALFKRSERTIDRWIKGLVPGSDIPPLPVVRVNGQVFISKRVLTAWVKAVNEGEPFVAPKIAPKSDVIGERVEDDDLDVQDGE